MPKTLPALTLTLLWACVPMPSPYAERSDAGSSGRDAEDPSDAELTDGRASDAGAVVDAGGPRDVGASMDRDAELPRDSGPAPDTGAPRDAGSAPDGGPTPDAGMISDAETALDAGATADAGLGCPACPSRWTARLSPAPGISGRRRVSFAVPLSAGRTRQVELRAFAGGAELATGSRGLARWPDGSWRAIEVQVEVDVGLLQSLELELGPASTALALVPVADTLVEEQLGGMTVSVPAVWVTLEAEALAGSGVFGRLSPESASSLAPSSAWARLCDYARWDTQAFLSAGAATAREVWLYDRPTVLYRGHARRGDLPTLQSAYREASLYFRRVSLAGGSASLNLPQGGGTDAKYVYTQGLAYHYLLTGDDRYREAAEGLATLADGLFDPEYVAGQHWTERHAGFTLLAAVHAAIVSDDRAAELWATAARRVAAYLAVQAGYTETPANSAASARCFGHDKVAADENDPYPATMVCSPWMSAILADALDTYASEVGGADAARVQASLISLGRRLAASDDVSPEGQPHYVLGVDGLAVPDEYHEHWGETAYVVALADLLSGRSDPALDQAAQRLAAGFHSLGEVGQVRSFNWQCRSAVSTPALLRP